MASVAVRYASIPAVMRLIGSDPCRRALFDFVRSRAVGSNEVARELCRWTPAPGVAELLEIDNLVDDRGVHREILRLLLAQKSPVVVDRFANELEDGFIYMDFRDRLSPEIVEALERHVDRLDGEARVHARMLIALGQKDAVGELLNLLGDDRWADKNIVFYELSRLGDPRATRPAARFLRDAPKRAVKGDGGLAIMNTIKHALEAIAHTGTAEAIRELIELLPVDLARFGDDTTRKEWNLVVAGHLIELTGESFGTDVEKWRVWQRAHAEHSVPGHLANRAGGFRTNPGSAMDFGSN